MPHHRGRQRFKMTASISRDAHFTTCSKSQPSSSSVGTSCLMGCDAHFGKDVLKSGSRVTPGHTLSSGVPAIRPPQLSQGATDDLPWMDLPSQLPSMNVPPHLPSHKDPFHLPSMNAIYSPIPLIFLGGFSLTFPPCQLEYRIAQKARGHSHLGNMCWCTTTANKCSSHLAITCCTCNSQRNATVQLPCKYSNEHKVMSGTILHGHIASAVLPDFFHFSCLSPMLDKPANAWRHNCLSSQDRTWVVEHFTPLAHTLTHPESWRSWRAGQSPSHLGRVLYEWSARVERNIWTWPKQ